jgi:hypothetical protein
MTTRLIISKYHEDVSWTSSIKHEITIYDKSDNPIKNSIPLPNIGKESNTFLYHISNNYENLDDVNIFLQGDPTPHICGSFGSLQQFLNELETRNYNDKPLWIGPFTRWGSPSLYDPWFDRARSKNIFLNFPENKDIAFSFGAQYMVTKNALQSRPKKFWEKIYEQSKTNLKPDDNLNKIDPWTFEILWPLIYDPIHKINPEF